MLYDLTLRDLAIPGSILGVCLRLHGCREIQKAFTIGHKDAFLSGMGIAKVIGYQMIAAGVVKTVHAVAMPDDWLERLESDVDSAELQSDDPLYRIANDYDTHQHMREAIRKTLMREVRRAKGAELHELCRNMCLLSLWLALHDPDFANAVRQRLLDCIKTFNQAMLTVACSKKLAYVRSIDPVPVDLTEQLRQADNAPPFTSRAWVS